VTVEIGPEVRAVLDSNALAHLVTLNADGSPHVSLAWAGLEDGEVVIGTLPDQRKLRNIRRDARVAVNFVTGRKTEMGLDEYLVIYGTARITEGGAPELLQKLAETYIGPGIKFPPMPDPPPGYVTRIKPEKYGGLGPWNNPF
jgi:PPOX class probable F420-dependent enzyme